MLVNFKKDPQTAYHDWFGERVLIGADLAELLPEQLCFGV